MSERVQVLAGNALLQPNIVILQQSKRYGFKHKRVKIEPKYSAECFLYFNAFSGQAPLEHAPFDDGADIHGDPV